MVKAKEDGPCRWAVERRRTDVRLGPRDRDDGRPAVVDSLRHRREKTGGVDRVAGASLLGWRDTSLRRGMRRVDATRGGGFTGLGLKTRAESTKRTRGTRGSTWRHLEACVETKLRMRRARDRRISKTPDCTTMS